MKLEQIKLIKVSDIDEMIENASNKFEREGCFVADFVAYKRALIY